jgi:neutral ceramidase
MRLWSRAFYFEDRNGKRLVFVSCDLFGIPGSLTASVGQRVADLGISPDELIIAATHTHQGPGNFLSTRGYNDFASSYPGFDRGLFDFLAMRIAESIRDAAKQARESSDDVQLLLRRGRWEDYVRNRAPEPFLLNSDRDAVMNELNPSAVECKPICPDPEYECEPKNAWGLEGCPRLRATDPNLTLLEVRRGKDSSKPPLGLLIFFSVHPTVLRREAPIFSSDFTGWGVDFLERTLAQGTDKPVVGFFNGADGDISARRLRRDLKDVRRIGTAFAETVQDVRKTTGFEVAGPIDVRVAPGPTSKPCRSSVWKTSDEQTRDIQLAARPMYGVAGIGGGEGDRTVLFQLGWSDGVRGEPKDGQVPKQPALDSPVLRHLDLTAAIAKADTFPNSLPVTLARLGSLSIATMPAELTTAMAFEIRHKLDFHKDPFVMVGPANEYASYVTSPSEYASQDYAAASTIWGANEGVFLGCLLETLQKDKEAPAIRLRIDPLSFRPGSKPKKPYGPFGPSFLASRRSPDEELEWLLVDRNGLPERHLPYFEWEEAVLSAEGSQEEFDAVSRRTVAVLSGENPVDPDGQGGLLTMLVDSGGSYGRAPAGFRRWGAIWVRPLWDMPKGRFTFRVTGGDGKPHCSEEFDPAEILKTDPPRAIQPRPCPGASSAGPP